MISDKAFLERFTNIVAVVIAFGDLGTDWDDVMDP